MQAIRATLLLCLLIIASVADSYNTWIHPRSLCILGFCSKDGRVAENMLAQPEATIPDESPEINMTHLWVQLAEALEETDVARSVAVKEQAAAESARMAASEAKTRISQLETERLRKHVLRQLEYYFDQ